MTSLQGHLLVASPHLPDPNFFRSVVLIIQHNDQGAFGLILNRPSRATIAEVWEKIGGQKCSSRQAIHVGGPVEGPLMAVHGRSDCSESEILPGIHFCTHKDFLEQLVGQQEFPFRIFSGYSGWGQGQLDNELQAGGWLTVPATEEYVFRTSDDQLWKLVSQQIGQDILQSSLRIKRLPTDPQMN